jgi:hypothetical protein
MALSRRESMPSARSPWNAGHDPQQASAVYINLRGHEPARYVPPQAKAKLGAVHDRQRHGSTEQCVPPRLSPQATSVMRCFLQRTSAGVFS